MRKLLFNIKTQIRLSDLNQNKRLWEPRFLWGFVWSVWLVGGGGGGGGEEGSISGRVFIASYISSHFIANTESCRNMNKKPQPTRFAWFKKTASSPVQFKLS